MGETVDYRVKETEYNKDEENAKERHHDHLPALSFLETIMCADGSTIGVYVGIKV